MPPTQGRGRKGKGGRAKKLRCEDCFFHQNMLCALGLEEPCPTFRPAHPDGLRPPRQLSFVFRHPPRTRAFEAPPVPQPPQSQQAAL
jgi:hypothetical protein